MVRAFLQSGAAKWIYKKHTGYTPMVGHIAETEQVVSVDFRDGNEPPNKDSYEFIRQCEEELPHGVSVIKVRIDAAGYQASIIKYLMETGKRFAIRAKMDTTLKGSISSIKADQWEALVYADGTVSETEQVARTVHVMGNTDAFTLVVQRKCIDKGDNANLETLIEAEDITVPPRGSTFTVRLRPTSMRRRIMRSCSGITFAARPARTRSSNFEATLLVPTCRVEISLPMRCG